MAARKFTDEQNWLGRELTADVGTLALTMPVTASGAFLQVVLPFVFVAALALVVLFATPFRDVPFIGEHATAELAGLRWTLLAAAFLNFAWPGYTEIDAFEGRWLVATGIAVLSAAVVSIDVRRTFPV